MFIFRNNSIYNNLIKLTGVYIQTKNNLGRGSIRYNNKAVRNGKETSRAQLT